MALATAAASPAIKYVSVFCDGSQPRLAMLLNRTPAPGALPFSLVFRGGMVNLPMTRGNREAKFWIAVLDASSPLPRMLARDRESVVSGTSVSVRVDLGGRSNIKKKKKNN